MPDLAPFETWCQRLKASDRDAFEQVFRAMHDAIFRYARSITKDGASARDVTQDVFVSLWEVRSSLDPDRSLEAYLYRMARNRAYNHQRDRRTRADKHDQIREESVAQPPEPETPDTELNARMLKAHLRTWVEELPDRQREAFTLSRFEGLSHDDIADIMDISPRTVNNHIVRALKHLRARIRVYEPGLLEQ